MQTKLIGTVLGATRYAMESNKGGSLYMTQPTHGNNPDIVGNEVLKMGMDYDLFESLKNFTLPGEFEVVADVEMGSQNRPRLTVLTITSVSGSVSSKTSVSDSKK